MVHRRNAWTLLAVAAPLACTGVVGDDASGADPTGAGAPTTDPAVDPAGDPLVAGACSATYAPGHVGIHRLTNEEYNNTVRDLLFTTSRPADAFDPPTPGQSGFSNDSDNLKITDDLVSSYYSAAEALAGELVKSKGVAGGAYATVVTCAPSTACARSTLATLAGRAYRRPATSDELASLQKIFDADTDFDTGIADVVIGLLVSPKFLFVAIVDPKSQTPGATFTLEDFALAARLSYGLWQSMPDDELTQLAQGGKLHDPSTLREQVTRMLRDPKARSAVKAFRNDWMALVTLADPKIKVDGLDDAVRQSMVGEVDAFLQDLVRTDQSPLRLVNADYTFVNQAMATYYGVPFPGGDPNEFVRVSMPANRIGVVTSPALMTATAASPTLTHPVHRGKWVIANVLCAPPPPPPPNVPPLPASGGATPRQKLLEHVKNPACNGCHQVMDTMGLGLENYDPLGKWRDQWPGSAGAIDASGTLPDGKSFATPVQMFSDLAEDQQTRACLAERLMGFLLTRALSSSDDRCVTKAIGQSLVTPEGKLSDVVGTIVRTRQFLMQTGEAP
jgi:hypothetical protein